MSLRLTISSTSSYVSPMRWRGSSGPGLICSSATIRISGAFRRHHSRAHEKKETDWSTRKRREFSQLPAAGWIVTIVGDCCMQHNSAARDSNRWCNRRHKLSSSNPKNVGLPAVFSEYAWSDTFNPALEQRVTCSFSAFLSLSNPIGVSMTDKPNSLKYSGILCSPYSRLYNSCSQNPISSFIPISI